MLAIRNFKLKDGFVLHGIKSLDRYWLFNTENGEHYELNSTSYVVLEQLQGKKGFDDLLQELKNSFEVDQETAVADLKELLNYLLEEQIIQKEPEEPKEGQK